MSNNLVREKLLWYWKDMVMVSFWIIVMISIIIFWWNCWIFWDILLEYLLIVNSFSKIIVVIIGLIFNEKILIWDKLLLVIVE